MDEPIASRESEEERTGSLRSTLLFGRISLRTYEHVLEVEARESHIAGILGAMFCLGVGAWIFFNGTKFGNALGLRLLFGYFGLSAAIVVFALSFGRERLVMDIRSDRFEYKASGSRAFVRGKLSDLASPVLATDLRSGVVKYHLLRFEGAADPLCVFSDHDRPDLERLREEICAFRRARG